MSNLLRRERCPKCADEGRDTAGDNLYVYESGPPYCHGGHGAIEVYFEPAKEKRVKSKLNVSDCMLQPDGHDPRRCIPESVWRAYGIKTVYDEGSGDPKRVYYPFYDNSGNVSGYKIRILPKDFLVAGRIDGGFGKQNCRPSPIAPLIIVEGEEDLLAMKAMLEGTSWDKWDVYSLPNGANVEGKLDQCVLNDQDFFAGYKQIVIFLDNDVPGKATAKRLANWLIGFIDKVKIVFSPAGKDASDVYLSGNWPALKQAIIDAKVFSPEGIIHGNEISIQDLLTPSIQGYSIKYPGLQEKLHGLRKGELLTVCAGSGIGKSTIVRELGYDLVTRHNLTVCHIALEDIVTHTASAYVAMDNGVPPAVFRSNPSCIPVADIEDSMDRTIRKMYFFNHFGSIRSDEFKSKLAYYARSGVDFIILDHLSMVISGSDVANERKEIDKIMTDLASMVVETGVGLINVVHLKRRETREGKSLNEGGQVSLTDLRGSAALEQLSWGVIAIERDTQAEDGSEDFATLRVLKNRTWGFTGKAGRVRYDHSTGRLEPVEEEEVHHCDEEPEEVVKEEESSDESNELVNQILDLLGSKEGT